MALFIMGTKKLQKEMDFLTAIGLLCDALAFSQQMQE